MKTHSLSFPLASRLPNCPTGSSRLTLFDPTNFCARLMIAALRLSSPAFRRATPFIPQTDLGKVGGTAENVVEWSVWVDASSGRS